MLFGGLGADGMIDIKMPILALSGLLAACSTTTQEAPRASVCRPDAAAKLAGHPAPDDAQVEEQTGANLVRRIAPGDPVTHDYRENRITLAIDPAGKVVQAVCG